VRDSGVLGLKFLYSGSMASSFFFSLLGFDIEIMWLLGATLITFGGEQHCHVHYFSSLTFGGTLSAYPHAARHPKMEPEFLIREAWIGVWRISQIFTCQRFASLLKLMHVMESSEKNAE